MCVFCDIINKKEAAHIVYEDKNLISFLDIEPINEGHILVVPKMHVDSVDKISDDVLSDIMKVIKKITLALKEVYGNEGYSIMQNGGKYCDFGHAHFHVFPRYDNDGFSWTDSGKTFEYSKNVAEKIAKAMKMDANK